MGGLTGGRQSASSTPVARISDEEVAQTDIALKQHERYLEGRPLQDRYNALTTGREVDGEGGTRIIEGGILNADGSVKTDTTASQLATESAATQGSLEAYQRGDIDSALEQNIELATGEASDSAQTAFEDQSNYLQGLDNIAAQGQGEETVATLGGLEQAQESATNAQERASRLRDRDARRRSNRGAIIGTGIGAASQLIGG